MSTIRGILFNLGYAVITVVWGSLSLIVGALMPYRMRFRFIVETWSRLILGWLRITCGITHSVEGMENVPSEPCVVLAKHQSSWETFFLQTVFVPQATVIKRELLRIPFFGWAFSLLRPIAIDRSQRIGAMKQLLRDGKARLDAGIWVVLLPEGTRLKPGESASFYRGGAALAQSAGRPVVVVAHDAGRCWPARDIRKHPGVVRVRISPPIASDNCSVNELNARAEAWLLAAMQDIEQLDDLPGIAPEGRS